MKRIVLLLLVALGFVAQAQITHTQQGNVDKTAQEVLQKASKQLNSTAVSFSVTMVNKDTKKKETARQDAKVLYNKGKYRLTFGEQVVYCDGAAVWHWNKEVNECTVNKLDTKSTEDLMNPAALLNNYSKNFKAKYIRTDADGTAVIDLTPKQGRSYYKIRLLCSYSTGVLKRLEIHNYDGSCGEYQVSGFKSGVTCNDSDFTFSKAKNPKVEIIDMR